MQTFEVPYHDLWTKPFRENTDPNFLWLGPQYRDAFAALRAAVLQNAGVLVLTGDVGTGKTMLARALADSLRAEGVRVGRLAYVGLHPSEFWNAVAQALELPGVADTHAGVPAHIGEFLHGAYARREKILLILDEAQDLVPLVLDEIDQLARAGLEAGRGKVNVINILLVGQPAIEALGGFGDPRGGEDRVAVRLRPLPPEQVAEYVAFRLRVAGADRALFSGDAIADIGTAAAGVPRLINRICDCALQVASQRNERVVSAEGVAETLSDFGLTTPGWATRPRLSARRVVRRIAYAAVLTLAVGLGVVVYHGGGSSNVHDNPRADDLTSAPGIPGAPASVPAPVAGSPGSEPASTPFPADDARQGGAAEGPRPAVGRLPIQPTIGAPRPDISRMPKPTIPETRADRLEPERARLATPAVSPTKVRTPPATATRSDERASGSPVPTATTRPDASGSEESEDPAAIINWLLQGTRPGVER